MRQLLLCLALPAALTLVPVSLASPAAAAPRAPVGGQAAVEQLGDRLPEVAAANRMSAERLTALLRSDPTLRVGAGNRLLYIDTALPPRAAAPPVAHGPYPYSSTFRLHSKPGSKHTIFLDVDGATVSGTAWNASGLPNGFYGGLDSDGDPSTFSAAEQDVVQSVWQRVAEDYAPLDVDVTTQDPGDAALDRDTAGDDTYGSRALVSGSDVAWQATCGKQCGGVAYLSVFGTVGNASYSPAWIFTGGVTADNPKYIAEALSHEVGHNVGLNHDGTSTEGYYAGQGLWAPVMGVGYYQPLSDFSNGDYADANNPEDDYALMGANGLPLRADDVPTRLDLGTAASFTRTGIIEARDDIDAYGLRPTCPGPLSVTATPAPNGPDLDVALTLLDAGGSPVATADPTSSRVDDDHASGLDAAFSVDVPAGSYTLRVQPTGSGDPLATGYSTYGVRGAYSLAISECVASATAPSEPTSVSASKDDAARSATLTWSTPASDGGSAITGYRVSRSPSPGSSTGFESLRPSTHRGYTFTGLVSGATYSLTVTAVNAVGDSVGVSRTVTLASKPSAPRIGTASAGAVGGAITATARWSAPASTGGSAITGYIVRAYKSGTTTVVKSAMLSPTLRSKVMTLPSGGTWSFTAQAVNVVGGSPMSARSNAVKAQ